MHGFEKHRSVFAPPALNRLLWHWGALVDRLSRPCAHSNSFCLHAFASILIREKREKSYMFPANKALDVWLKGAISDETLKAYHVRGPAPLALFCLPLVYVLYLPCLLS